MAETPAVSSDTLISLTAEIVAAHVGTNNVAMTDLPNLITSIHGAFSAIATAGQEAALPPRPVPAVSIRSSVKDDYLVCLEDGKKLKMLRRYLQRQFNMTPDEYRTKWGLPANYPMVAPAYAARRSELAKSFGLGKAPQDGSPRTAGRKRVSEKK
jgi:predicted transcriptional regulator